MLPCHTCRHSGFVQSAKVVLIGRIVRFRYDYGRRTILDSSSLCLIVKCKQPLSRFPAQEILKMEGNVELPVLPRLDTPNASALRRQPDGCDRHHSFTARNHPSKIPFPIEASLARFRNKWRWLFVLHRSQRSHYL